MTLYTREWLSELPPRGAIVIIHGLGEHCARYQHVAEYLIQGGYAVYSFDHRGHGRSQGKRGHIQSYEVVMGDIQQHLVDVARQFPGVPLFIYGHSLGGALALNYLLTRKPDICGAVVTSPSLAPGAPVGASKLAFARLLSHLAPSFTMDNGLDTNNLSHDPDVVQCYITDPLNTPHISASLAMQLIDRGAWMLTQKELPVPTLLMQGTKDHLVNLSATRQFAQNISPNHLTYKEWDSGFHELHNEPFKQEVLDFIRGWLDQRLVVASA